MFVSMQSKSQNVYKFLSTEKRKLHTANWAKVNENKCADAYET